MWGVLSLCGSTWWPSLYTWTIPTVLLLTVIQNCRHQNGRLALGYFVGLFCSSCKDRDSLRSRRFEVIGNLSNDDGDGNENGKKAIGLSLQKNNFARASRFFIHLFTCTLLPVSCPLFLSYFEKNSSYVSGVSVCIFVALYLCMFGCLLQELIRLKVLWVSCPLPVRDIKL